MSAYMVDKTHIDLLVATAIDGPRGVDVNPGNAWNPPRWPDVPWRELAEMGFQEAVSHLRDARELGADFIGLLLAAENIASINARYPDTIGNDEAVPGRIYGPDETPYWRDYHFEDLRFRLTPVETLGAIRGYQYQACEHGGWHDSEAKRFCDALAHAVSHYLPGMDDAPWEWTPERLAEHRQGMHR